MPSSGFLTYRVWKAPGFQTPWARNRRIKIREYSSGDVRVGIGSGAAISYAKLLVLEDPFLSSVQSSWGGQMGKSSNRWPFWICSQCDPYFVTAGSSQLACLAQLYGRAVQTQWMTYLLWASEEFLTEKPYHLGNCINVVPLIHNKCELSLFKKLGKYCMYLFLGM